MEIIIATMPLWVAIVMLVVLQRPSQQAGLATLIAAMGSTLLFPVFRLFPGLMGAQNGASAHATMISPARAIIAATAVGWSGAEVFLLRQMGLVVLGAVAVIMSLLVLAVP